MLIIHCISLPVNILQLAYKNNKGTAQTVPYVIILRQAFPSYGKRSERRRCPQGARGGGSSS